MYTTNSGVMVQTPRRESLEIRLRHELNGMRDLNDDAAASWKKAADDAAELRRQIVRQWCSLWCSVFPALCARMVSQRSLTHTVAPSQVVLEEAKQAAERKASRASNDNEVTQRDLDAANARIESLREELVGAQEAVREASAAMARRDEMEEKRARQMAKLQRTVAEVRALYATANGGAPLPANYCLTGHACWCCCHLCSFERRRRRTMSRLKAMSHSSVPC